MEKIPETAADISPYATSDFQTMPLNSGMGRNTIGRKETMRMIDYQQHQLSQPDMGSMGTVGTLGTGGMVNTVGRHRVGVFFKLANHSLLKEDCSISIIYHLSQLNNKLEGLLTTQYLFTVK